MPSPRHRKDLVLRSFLVLILAMGLLMCGCAPPEEQTDGSRNEQRAEKATKNEGSSSKKTPDQQDSEPDSSGGGEKQKPESSGSDKPNVSNPQSGPEDVLALQYRHLNASNYGAAYDLFDSRSQQLVSLEQYSAFFISAAPYKLTSYAFRSVQVQNDTARVVADLTVSSSEGQEQYQATQDFVREDGDWRVVMRDEQVASFTAGSASSSPSSDASASASTPPEDSAGNPDATTTVSRVVDGDTIEISPAVDGNNEVRLIGMDTPETVDPSEEVEPLGLEASSFATNSLEGQSVGLEFDVEKEDQYDRLLAYVYVDGEMFNEVLVEEGYAQAYPYEPNTRYEDRFAAAQQEARTAGLGMWRLTNAEQCQLADRGNGIGEGTSGCSGASASASSSTSATAGASKPSGASPAANEPSGGAVAPVSENDCPLGAPIKGNESSGIYHVPDGAYYDETDPEQCFATPQDAENAGYRASEV